jgi:hypothetical protein
MRAVFPVVKTWNCARKALDTADIVTDAQLTTSLQTPWSGAPHSINPRPGRVGCMNRCSLVVLVILPVLLWCQSAPVSPSDTKPSSVQGENSVSDPRSAAREW